MTSVVTSLDTAAIRDHRFIMEQRRDALGRGVSAADALLWFAEHALDRAAETVFESHITLSAEAAEGSHLAGDYIRNASFVLQAEVLDRAILTAKADFDQAKNQAGALAGLHHERDVR